MDRGDEGVKDLRLEGDFLSPIFEDNVEEESLRESEDPSGFPSSLHRVNT